MKEQRQCADCGRFFEPRYNLPADEETLCGNCPTSGDDDAQED